MSRILIVLTILAALPLLVWAGDECCPPSADPAANKTAMPAGHPPIGDSKLPAGHPPIAEGKMPAGHPAVGGGMPEGHPPVAGHGGGEAIGTGTMTIHAVQGTADAKPAAGADVILYLVSGRTPVKQFRGKTDDNGRAVFDNVPIMSMPLTTHAIVVHQGVGYQSRGAALTAEQTTAEVEVKVFETTTDAPPWTIATRHVMLAPDAEGVTVNDLIVVENPADRTWFVDPQAYSDETTLTLPLPAGAVQVQPGGGFFAKQTLVKGGNLVTTTPVMAGKSQFSYSYRLQPQQGVIVLPLAWAAPCARTQVFLPDDGATVTVTGLVDDGAKAMGSAKVRVLSAAETTPGMEAEIRVAGWKFPGPVAAGAPHGAEAEGTVEAPKLIAGVGVLGAVLVGVVLMFFRKPGRKAE